MSSDKQQAAPQHAPAAPHGAHGAHGAHPHAGKYSPVGIQLQAPEGTPDDALTNGPLCERPDRPPEGCHLTPAQRGRLIAFLGLRLVAAGSACQEALLKLRLERLLKRESGELGWLAALLLDAMGAHMIAMVAKIAAASTRAIPSLLGHLKTAVDASKRAARGRLVVDQDQRALAERTLELSYLTEISQEAGIAFQALRETAMTDDELGLMLEAFDAREHTVSAYELAFEGKLERLRTSGVAEIGISSGSPLAQLDDLPHAPAPVKERRVAWLLDPRIPRLVYQDAVTAQTGTRLSHSEPVPREFWSAALARHFAAWGAAPEYIEVDESGVTVTPTARGIASVRAAHDALDQRPYIGEPPTLGAHDE